MSFGKHNRSRSCPSVRCALCKHRHHGGIKMSESMQYTPRVTFQEHKNNSVRGSLPDLRPCACSCLRSRITSRSTAFRHVDSCGSTESILDEADDFLRESIDGIMLHDSDTGNSSGFLTKGVLRRCSENDIKKGKQQRFYVPVQKLNIGAVLKVHLYKNTHGSTTMNTQICGIEQIAYTWSMLILKCIHN